MCVARVPFFVHLTHTPLLLLDCFATQHLPIFAVSNKIFKPFFSSFHGKKMVMDSAARFLVRYQVCWVPAAPLVCWSVGAFVVYHAHSLTMVMGLRFLRSTFSTTRSCLSLASICTSSR